MTLTPGDDLPVHQIAEPVAHAATSDRNFYDRYYFNLHPCSDELFVIVGLGQYPNLGTTDAFIAVTDARSQRVVRASRELGGDRLATRVGPIRVEVLEGLRRLRVVCEPNEWGLQADLTFEAQVDPNAEPRMFERTHGRVVFDTCRFTQTGRWSGALTVDGERHEVTPDTWWGSRDRSWGIRPIGEAEPAGIRVTSVTPDWGFYWMWTTMQFDDHAVLALLREDGRGNRVMESAVRCVPGRDPEHLPAPVPTYEFVSGTRLPQAATISFGSELEVSATALRTIFLFGGTGYGGEGTWRHGAWQGAEKVEGVSYALDDPSVLRSITGLNDTLCRFEAGGQTGYGVLETGIFGAHLPTGFDTFDATAP